MNSPVPWITSHFYALLVSLPVFVGSITYVQGDTTQVVERAGAPVIFSGDTLLYLYGEVGGIDAEERAVAVSERLSGIVQTDTVSLDSIRLVDAADTTRLALGSQVIMSVTSDDASQVGTSRLALARKYASILFEALRKAMEEDSIRTLLINAGITLFLLVAIVAVFWGMRKVFPRAYAKLEGWEGTLFRTIRIRSLEIVSARRITAFFVVLLRGVRLALSLAIVYYFLTYVFSLFPWTRSWDIRPILSGLLLSILVAAAAFAVLKAVGASVRIFLGRIPGWKGTLIKPVRLKTIEILSAERIVELIELSVRVVHVSILAVVAYSSITLIFSLFEFTETWAGTLLEYVLVPVGIVLSAFINYLPNLFFILVIVLVTRYLIKFIRLFFLEVARGRIALPGFYVDWAQPTYKIVRFVAVAFAAIMIFPYLPGSESEAFKGVSIFLGVLFSLGSASAFANIVAGIVLTYMRPFNVGDRVKIADTVGDVVEKSLLVTRVRTVKNVDVTIPNAMVLSSHIINFSSSAEDRGLILHTTITIGYDVPWKKVHQLMVDAASSTQHVLKDPQPFVLQTSLNDYSASYELNAYTDQPNRMALIYSDLHQNIQNKFNEAGVEILSPQYTAVRDGNRTAIPEDYLPKGYSAPAFRIFPFGNTFKKPGDNPSSE